MGDELFRNIKDYQMGSGDSALYILNKFAPIIKRYTFLLQDEDAMSEIQYQLLKLVKEMDLPAMRSTSEGALVKYIEKIVRSKYIALIKGQIKQRKITALDDLNPYDLFQYNQKSSQHEAYDGLLLHDLEQILCPSECTVIYLLYFENFTITEIAARLHKSRQAVNQTKLKALAKLRKKFLP